MTTWNPHLQTKQAAGLAPLLASGLKRTGQWLVKRPVPTPSVSKVQRATAWQSDPRIAKVTQHKIPTGLRYVAAVPPGELFVQRPIRNTASALSLAGVPGFNRLSQLTLGGTLATGAYGAYQTNQNINQSLDDKVALLKKSLNASPEQAEAYGLKRDVIRDTTLGNIRRNIGRMLGYPISDRQVSHDRHIRDLAVSQALQSISSDPDQALLDTVKRNRTPLNAAAQQTVNRLAKQYRTGVEIIPKGYQGIKDNVTSLERIGLMRLNNLRKILQPEQLNRLDALRKLHPALDLR